MPPENPLPPISEWPEEIRDRPGLIRFWTLRQAGLTIDDMRQLSDDQCDVLLEISQFVDDHALHAEEYEAARRGRDAFFG